MTAGDLRALLNYDPDTGVFTWRVKPNRRIAAGAVAGHVRSDDGYVGLQIASVPYFAHRLAWTYMTGSPAPENIDHRNGIRHDNKWSNLREATHAINQQNKRKAKPGSKSGVLGAYPSGRGFRSMIGVNGKVYRLGTFDTAAEAHEAYVAAKRILHPGCTL